ncbi:MAG: hypothetical protein EAZ97_10575 [Bacteroidetes bacterium]|nr:MAG: hypothetical protein EAZ97_10575 [Bacteroidota bacterium]
MALITVFVSYIKENLQTGERYVGRTSGEIENFSFENIFKILRKRDSNHAELNEKGFEATELDQQSENYPAIRGREQQLIEYYQKQGNCANKINGISKRNKKLKFYLAAAIETFGEIFLINLYFA